MGLRKQKATFDDAKTFCQNENMTLSTLQSTNEVDWVYRNFEKDLDNFDLNYCVWLDASKDSGKFVWPDQTEVKTANWYSGEPNGSGNCIRMCNDGKWYDGPCASTRPFICKVNV